MNKLVDVEIDRISLVKRGAMRAPFKVLKSEDVGMTLEQIFDEQTRSVLKEETNQESIQENPVTDITSVVVSRKADLEKTKIQLEAAGFSTEHIVDEEDKPFVLFRQKEDDASPEERLVLKFDEHLAVVIPGHALKGLETYEAGQAFGHAMAKEGFLPGLHLASNVYLKSIQEAAQDSDDTKELKSKIKQASRAFGEYVQGLANALPANIFKLDGIQLPLIEEEEPKEEVVQESTEEVVKAEATETPEEAVKTEVEVTEEPTMNPALQAAIGSMVTKEELKNMTESLAASLKEVLNPLSEQLGKVQEDLKTVSQKAEEAVEQATEARDSLSRIVPGQVEETIDPFSTSALGRSDQTRIPPLDTAMKKREPGNMGLTI